MSSGRDDPEARSLLRAVSTRNRSTVSPSSRLSVSTSSAAADPTRNSTPGISRRIGGGRGLIDQVVAQRADHPFLVLGQRLRRVRVDALVAETLDQRFDEDALAEASGRVHGVPEHVRVVARKQLGELRVERVGQLSHQPGRLELSSRGLRPPPCS